MSWCEKRLMVDEKNCCWRWIWLLFKVSWLCDRVIHKFDEDVFEYNVPFSNISAYMLMVNNNNNDDKDRVCTHQERRWWLEQAWRRWRETHCRWFPAGRTQSCACRQAKVLLSKIVEGFVVVLVIVLEGWKGKRFLVSLNYGRGMSYVYRFFLIFHEQINCRALSKQV